MLPLIQLKSSDMPAFDAMQATAIPGPEGAAVLKGTFADLLQVRIGADAALQQVPGEALPPSGYVLPPLQSDLLASLEVSAASAEDNVDAQLETLPAVPLTGWAVTTSSSNLSPAGNGSDSALPTRPAGAGMPPALEIAAGLPRSTLDSEPLSPPTSNALQPVPARLDGPTTGMIPAATGKIDLQAVDALAAEALRPVVMPPVAVTGRDRTSSPRSPVFAIADSLSAPVRMPDAVPEAAEPGGLLRQGRLAEERVGLIPEDARVISRLPQSQAAASDSLELDPISLSTASSRSVSDVAQNAPRQAVAQTLDVHVQNPGWDKAISERVLLMANGKMQNVEIRLTPADLGPLRVQLVIDDSTANVSFQAQHAVTREAIEQALPRLREMLAENGLSLGQANVSDDGVQREASDGMAGQQSDELAGADEAASDAPSRRVAVSIDALVDTFA